VEKDVSARRALILSLGEYDGKRLPQKDRKPLVETLLRWYGEDPDPGVHSAIGWLLRNSDEGATARPLDWGQAKTLDAIDGELRGKQPHVLPSPRAHGESESEDNRRGAGGERGAGWYVNGQGQTMVMIRGPVEFRMGSPRWEKDRHAANEPWHVRRIDRSYALASTAVTVAQYREFLKDNPDVPKDFSERYSPEQGGPIISVSWYAAARYCNWLSEKEGIPEEQWCYAKKIGRGMRMTAGYLKRTGYRLPTESELEYATKAGSQQSRCFGSAEALLPRYAHFHGNSKDRAWPVGRKRPNDLGLFDLHGNVWNWCQDKSLFYPRRGTASPAADVEDMTSIDESSSHALRGGSFLNLAPLVRSSIRLNDRPDIRSYVLGLRACRTLPSDSFTTLPPTEPRQRDR
jgi:formylglycine-generating enzyme required for sulfatase activity